MFSKTICPVDLAHEGKPERRLNCAADPAKLYGASVAHVGGVTTAPSQVAHNPAQFEPWLADFAASQVAKYSITNTAPPRFSHDPASDLEPTI